MSRHTIRRGRRELDAGLADRSPERLRISPTWAGVPLRSFDLMARCVAGTTTAAGLSVTAGLERGGNERGEEVADERRRNLRLTPHAVCPDWNYTLSPRPMMGTAN